MSSVSSTTSSTGTTTTTTTSSKSTSSTDYTTFDTTALVEAKLASRYARIDSLSSKVTKNQTKLTAYQDMQTKLQSLNTALGKLREDPSSAGRTLDVFRDRTAYLTSSTSTAASTYLSATVAEGTDLGKHNVTISKVAKQDIIGSSAVDQSTFGLGSPLTQTTALGLTASLTLGVTPVGGGAATTDTITVTAGMSLSDIADAVNAKKDSTGVKASVMKVSDTAFQLVLTSVNTGKDITTNVTSGDLSALGFTGATLADPVAQSLQAGQNAEFSVDGVTMTRSSNDISDALAGVTLHLYTEPTPGTKLTLEVDHDLSGIKQAISDFVTAYNAFRDLVIANQTTTTSGKASSDAVLFGDPTLRQISTTLQSALGVNVDTSALTGSSAISSLGAIGITLDVNNKLTINETTLDAKLQDNLDTIQRIFGYTMDASSSDIGMIRHADKPMSFTLNVVTDGSGNLVSASATDASNNTVALNVSGGLISGQAGTQYEGMSLYYTGNTTKSITIKMTQGLADKMYGAIDDVANTTDGSVQTMIDYLQGANSDLNDRISTLEESTANYKNALTSLYANMAAKMSTAQTTLDLLKALLNASTKN